MTEAEGRGEMKDMEGELEFGSSKCYCPKCGKEFPHAHRGVPCSETKCPKCGSPMIGEKCKEDSG